MRIVSPYQAFPVEAHPESDVIASFDWVAALRMLDRSAQARAKTGIIVLTDHATDVGDLPAFRYATTATRLQQWLIEIRLAYLRSDAFDQDTVLVSPDTLIMGPLDKVFLPEADLAILMRPGPKHKGQWKQILNSVQWWRYTAKDLLIAFYEEAWRIGQTLDEDLQVWGGDTEALRLVLAPIRPGLVVRAGMRVQMMPETEAFRSVSGRDVRLLAAGQQVEPPGVPLYDFKYLRKQYMKPICDQLFPESSA